MQLKFDCHFYGGEGYFVISKKAKESTFRSVWRRDLTLSYHKYPIYTRGWARNIEVVLLNEMLAMTYEYLYY